MHRCNKKSNRINKYLKVLLIGGLFLSTNMAISKIVMKDQFVYKVAGVVFTINDLTKYFESLNNLKCIYPETLLYRVFKKQFNQKKRVFFKNSGHFSSQQKQYFSSFIKFGKILVYSRSHDVQVKDSIATFFYLSAKNSNCSMDPFGEDKKFTKNFKEVVRLEIFMRSRFLPTEKQGKVSKADFEKAVLSSESLISSIDEQIDQEVYW